jgi:hypothetical protein
MGRRGWASSLFGRRRRTSGGQPEPAAPELKTFGDFTHEELAGLTADADNRPLIVHEQVKGVLDGLYDRITVDEHYMRATRRWNEDAPDPLEFVPGDVLVLRLLAARPSIQEALLLHAALQDGKWPPGGEEMLDWRLRHDTSVASWLFDAVPYFLPVHDAVSILDSHPPEPDMLAELRLPFPAVTVYFGADLEFDPAFLRWSEGAGRTGTTVSCPSGPGGLWRGSAKRRDGGPDQRDPEPWGLPHRDHHLRQQPVRHRGPSGRRGPVCGRDQPGPDLHRRSSQGPGPRRDPRPALAVNAGATGHPPGLGGAMGLLAAAAWTAWAATRSRHPCVA